MTREEFERVFLGSYGALCLFALRALPRGYTDDAQDVVQSVFVSVYERVCRGSFRPHNLFCYLVSAVRFTAASWDRRHRKRVSPLSDIGALYLAVSTDTETWKGKDVADLDALAASVPSQSMRAHYEEWKSRGFEVRPHAPHSETIRISKVRSALRVELGRRVIQT